MQIMIQLGQEVYVERGPYPKDLNFSPQIKTLGGWGKSFLEKYLLPNCEQLR